MTSGTVLVTGAGGFIGRAVVRRLASARIPVRAGYRTRPEPDVLPPGCEAVTCDLDRPAALRPTLDGVDVVVHAAFSATSRMEVELAALLSAADASGVRRVVYFSSVAVYGEREGTLDEGAEPSGAPDPYGSAKRACERMLRAWVDRDPGSRAAVILRPGIVYGRGSRSWIDRPLAALAAGTLAGLGRRGEGVAGLVHVEDLAEATGRAVDLLLGPGPLGFASLVLNVTGPDQPSWNAFFQALADRTGLGPLRTIGTAELQALRTLAVLAKTLVRLRLPAPAGLAHFPASGELRLFARRATYLSDAARARLGWTPAIGLDQGLAMSLPAAEPTT